MSSVLLINIDSACRARIHQLIDTDDKHVTIKAFGHSDLAISWVKSARPDLIILDCSVEEPGPIDFICQVRTLPQCAEIPIIILSQSGEPDLRSNALQAGANDFLIKPFTDAEFLTRYRSVTTLRQQRGIIKDRNHWLQKTVSARMDEVQERERETLLRLAKAGEYRDSETGNHVLRMASYSRLIAEGLGFSQEDCDLIELAAPMHDIGKIGIPDHVLLKPGQLTNSEWRAMQQHTWVGYDILRNSPSKYLQKGAIIALSHHERYDGNGYPQQLTGEDIPMEARIVTVADVFDALMSKRPYKPAWSVAQSVEFLRTEQGKHFDPECVNAFLRQLPRVNSIRHRLTDVPIAVGH